jgi:tight adherence protein B
MNPVILVVIGVVILVLVIAAVSIRSQRANTVEERLGRFTDMTIMAVPTEEEEKKKGKGKKQPSELTKRMDEALTRRGVGSGWRTQLARADLKLTVAEFMALHIISLFGMALLAFFVLWPGQIVQTIIAGGIGLFIPRIYVANKQAGRFKNFEQQLPDILSLWVNSLRSGYSVMQALEAISREAPEPSAAEIRRVVQEAQLGINLEDALDHLLERMPSEDLDLIITAVNIQREVGGNLAEILEVIGHTIRERIKLKGEIRVMTSQGRITGYLISGLPIVLALFLMLINPNYMGNLFNNPGCGWPLLGIGLGMIGIGTAVIQKIVDIDI